MAYLNLSSIDQTELNERVLYRSYWFKIQRNASDYNGDIDLSCHADAEGELGPWMTGLVLRPLWQQNWNEDEPAYKKKFSEGDYFQQTIKKDKERTMPHFAEILHDFLLEHAATYNIQNVFSTNEDEDEGFDMSNDAKGFWQRRIDKGAAELDTQLHRYKIVWANERVIR
jgi:hypothetical protein